MALPKWTDERTSALTDFVGDESPVSQATVAEAAAGLETSTIGDVAQRAPQLVLGFQLRLGGVGSRQLLVNVLQRG